MFKKGLNWSGSTMGLFAPLTMSGINLKLRKKVNSRPVSMAYFLFFTFLISTDAYSQNEFVDKKNDKRIFQVFQVDSQSDMSSLKAPRNLLKDIPKKKTVSKNDRDAILEKYIPKVVAKMDELDRDLLFNRLIHYKKNDFMKRYKNSVSPGAYSQLSKEASKFK